MCCQSVVPSVWVGIGVTPSTGLAGAPEPEPEPDIEPDPPVICPIVLGAAGLVEPAALAVVESVRDVVPQPHNSTPATASSAATASANRGARVRQVHRRPGADIASSVANDPVTDASLDAGSWVDPFGLKSTPPKSKISCCYGDHRSAGKRTRQRGRVAA
jgi:hypothetical protein